VAAQFVRRDIHSLAGPWADPVLWYAKGVAALQARALDDPTSWRFLAAIHGIDGTLWRGFGALAATDRIPTAAVQRTYWQQCQHGSWYFLPWHRGYLAAFEAIVRAAVVAQGGPADWALPYWNYLNLGESDLPAEFGTPDWPGAGTNPLFVPQRYGPHGDGKVTVIQELLDVNALADPDFTGVSSGGSPGFGGIDTAFSHGGAVHGRLEKQPHDIVHVLVGGYRGQDLTAGAEVDRRRPGVMTDPDSAGLDPIFWLHHANIDRLWETWRAGPPVGADPQDADWLTGPRDRAFAAPRPDGTQWTYSADDVDLAALRYEYDDLSPGSAVVAPPTPADRRERLRTAAPAPARAEREEEAVASERDIELVGANSTELAVVGARVDTTVSVDPEAGARVGASLAAAERPDRVFLNLEDVRGLADGTILRVYVALPAGADPADHPERRAGTVGLFGVRKASLTDEEHAGRGLTFVLEITRIVDDLHLDESVPGTLGDRVPVTILPLRPVPADERLTIGRVSVFRQPS
jgi:tyrosinase